MNDTALRLLKRQAESNPEAKTHYIQVLERMLGLQQSTTEKYLIVEYDPLDEHEEVNKWNPVGEPCQITLVKSEYEATQYILNRYSVFFEPEEFEYFPEVITFFQELQDLAESIKTDSYLLQEFITAINSDTIIQELWETPNGWSSPPQFWVFNIE